MTLKHDASHQRSAIPFASTHPSTVGITRVARPRCSVLCVSDESLAVAGLRTRFAELGTLEMVGELASTADLGPAVDRLLPTIVLVSIDAPGPDVFEAVDRLGYTHGQARAVLLAGHVRDAQIAAARSCGAWGLFSICDDPDAVCQGLLDIARAPSHCFVLGPTARARCGNAARGDRPTTAMETLSPREIEVLRLIGRGMSRQDVAAELCRSPKTIDGHQERLLRKLGVANRTELMRLAIREGLADA